MAREYCGREIDGETARGERGTPWFAFRFVETCGGHIAARFCEAHNTPDRRTAQHRMPRLAFVKELSADGPLEGARQTLAMIAKVELTDGQDF